MEKEKGSRDDAMLRRRLPDSICQLTEGKACRREKTVLRGSELLIFDDCVLKITPCSREDEESVQVMRWLSCASRRAAGCSGGGCKGPLAC